MNTAFKLLIPTPANIQNFLNTQTGGNLSYLINTLLGSPASAAQLPCSPVHVLHDCMPLYGLGAVLMVEVSMSEGPAL